MKSPCQHCDTVEICSKAKKCLLREVVEGDMDISETAVPEKKQRKDYPSTDKINEPLRSLISDFLNF